jgi:phosphoenolpyruvate carboxykinase (ATP)
MAIQSQHGLEGQGFKNLGEQHWNLPTARLVEISVARNEGSLTNSGALNSFTGSRTGRSPRDKFVVEEPSSQDKLWWGRVNVPIAQEKFEALRARVMDYFQGKDVFVLDAVAGADPQYQLPIRVVTELAWHNLFVRQLFRRLPAEALATHQPEWVVINACNFHAAPERDGTRSEAFVILDIGSKTVLIGGTQYAGEMKKSIFTVLNYLYPQQGIFPMHCSANVGASGDVALFFGLSGTGKTTLSADPQRQLIGDDEHGWSDEGVFNFEGGCYAKCIRLSKKYEPQIWNAIRFGAVVENVIVDPDTREPNFDDDSITENTRAAYPLDFIDNALPAARAGHPQAVVFLACDAFGILPPVAILTPEQAQYHFLSGYTAALAGTEAGMGDEPTPTFSACFGAPFLPLHPLTYAQMLKEKLQTHNARVYLVNTGWTGGPFGVGERFKISDTRAIINAALSGALDHLPSRTDPLFGVRVPTQIPTLSNQDILDPRKTWANPSDYDARAKDLAARFVKNFAQFDGVPKEIVEAGPRVA